MEKAVLRSAKFTSPTCPEDVYLSDSDIGGSMTNILINRNVHWLTDHVEVGFYLISVSKGVVSKKRLQNYQWQIEMQASFSV